MTPAQAIEGNLLGLGGRFIIDNSVWQRQNQPAVRSAMTNLITIQSPLAVLTCPPVVAEVGFSARNSQDHAAVWRYLGEFPPCLNHPDNDLVLSIQSSLIRRGHLRAVGAIDTLIAAYAIENSATVLHYDSDFEHVAAVRDDFNHSWIAPRGSLDR